MISGNKKNKIDQRDFYFYFHFGKKSGRRSREPGNNKIFAFSIKVYGVVLLTMLAEV